MLKKPIFIIGTGRNGSTIFHRLLSDHPNIMWQSTLCNKYIKFPIFNKIAVAISDMPLLGKFVKNFLKPVETYAYFNYFYKGFSTPFRDLTADDVTNLVKSRLKESLHKLVTKKRNRLLIKITGWPRVGFLNEIFPDAKFIHLIRDGRAVVNSMINVNWWWGWRGPQNWRWGELSDLQNKEWLKHNKSFIALAAIEWKILMGTLEKSKEEVVSNNYFELRYEDLCDDPKTNFENVLEFCELSNSKNFIKSVSRNVLENRNYKWEEDFTDKQKAIVNDILGNYLKKYKYI